MGEVYIGDKDKNLLEKYKFHLHQPIRFFHTLEVLSMLHILYRINKYDTQSEYIYCRNLMIARFKHNDQAIRCINKIAEGKFDPSKLPVINSYLPLHWALVAELRNN